MVVTTRGLHEERAYESEHLSTSGPLTSSEIRPPWLQGTYAPVTEEVTLTDLPVIGAIPPELSGLLLRNGPNPFRPDSGTHWFVGDGMVHGVLIAGGRARWYRNRWVRTRRLAWQRGEGPAPQMDDGDSPANTHVIRHAGRILALCEGGLPYELTRHLDTVGMHDFGGRLVGPMTAHPKIDPVTGELVFFGYRWAPPFLQYHVADARGTLTHSVEIEVKGPTMMHDCAATATRTLFLDLPVCFDPEMVPRTGWPYRFRPEYGARIGVLPRHGDSASVKWFEVEPCYMFHTLNAYDDGPARVVLEAVRYGSMFEWSDEHGGFLPSPLAVLHRYTLDLDHGTVTSEALDDLTCEYPRIDDRRLGRRHRYGYGVGAVWTTPDWLAFRHLVQYDLGTGRRQIHMVGPADMNSEPVFAPVGPGEEEGYVLATVYNAARGATDVVILDATRFASPAVATVRLPVSIPLGFHGNWMPDIACD